MKKAVVAVGVVVLFCVASAVLAQGASNETQVRQVVQRFYDAFNAHRFEQASEFTTTDWNHINPLGGRTHGREAVLKELREVHSTFLKGVSDTVDGMDVRFADHSAAVVTVTSHMSTYTTPDGRKHEHESHIRTFVVVKRTGRWLIMQDQNTIVGG